MPKKGHRKELVVANVPRPEGVSQVLWDAVPRLVDYANTHGLGRPEIAALAGLKSTGNVTRWLDRETVPDGKSLLNIENGLTLAPGTFTSGFPATGNRPVPIDVWQNACALGMELSVIRALVGGMQGEEMNRLGSNLRRAVLGVVHIFGHPLETIIPIASKLAERSNDDDFTADQWVSAIREHEDYPRKPGSGTFPSYGQIKLG